MFNKPPFNFLLSNLGYLKRSGTSNRIQQFCWRHRNVAAVSKRCVRNFSCSDKNQNFSINGGQKDELVKRSNEILYKMYERNNYQRFYRHIVNDNHIVDGQMEWSVFDSFDKLLKSSVEYEELPGETINRLEDLELPRELYRQLRDVIEYIPYPIQLKTFKHLVDDLDVLLISRNGSGKTILYSMVLVNKLLKTVTKEPGRHPQLLILAPSAEHAWEISDAVELFADVKLSVARVHDGVHYNTQKTKVLSGVDIVVGTPDHIENLLRNQVLSLSDLRHVVLDGFDCEMNNSTLVDIIYQSQTDKIQTVIVMGRDVVPAWVGQLKEKYVASGLETFDYTSNPLWHAVRGKANCNFAVECHANNRNSLMTSLLDVHSLYKGQAIIFGQTKEEVDQLVMNNNFGQELAILHPDMPRERKEKVLKDLRNGHLKYLATTEDAPQFANFPNVDIVVHLGFPTDSNCYIHRSNQTKTGSSILLYRPSEEPDVRRYVQDSFNKKWPIYEPPEDCICDSEYSKAKRLYNLTPDDFQLYKVSPSRQPEILAAMAETTARCLSAVSEPTEKHFSAAARGLIAKHGPVSAVSSALAFIAGHDKKLYQNDKC